MVCRKSDLTTHSLTQVSASGLGDLESAHAAHSALSIFLSLKSKHGATAGGHSVVPSQTPAGGSTHKEDTVREVRKLLGSGAVLE